MTNTGIAWRVIRGLQEQAVYSDDEFASDGEYEAEFETENDSEGESDAVEQAAPGPNLSEPELMEFQISPVESSNETAPSTTPSPADPLIGSDVSSGRDSVNPSMPAGIISSASPNDAAPRASHLADSETLVEAAHPLSSDPSRESATESASASPSSPPRPVGQLGRAGTLRSLSTPAVPAVSLVDPHLLVPRNLRSTSVPVVLSAEIPDGHSLDKFRIEGRPDSGGSQRMKAFPRLSSVEEIQAPSEADDESSSDDSDSDNEGGSRGSTAARSPPPVRGRSSSIQLKQPVIVFPVMRAKSQPFITRLPSVIEVMAEEVATAEGTRDGDGEETRSDTLEESSASADDHERAGEEASVVPGGLLSDFETVDPLERQDDVGQASEDERKTSTQLGTEREEQASERLSTGDVAALYVDSDAASQAEDDAGDRDDGNTYEEHDGFDWGSENDNDDNEAERATGERNNTSSHTNEDKDDDDSDSDSFAELESEEQSRRETAQLLQEAQMLLRKQHDDEVTPSSRSESAARSSTSDERETIEAGGRSSATHQDDAPRGIGEALALLTSASVESVGVFETQYGDDEFSDADADILTAENDDDELNLYASDEEDQNDGEGDRTECRDAENGTAEPFTPSVATSDVGDSSSRMTESRGAGDSDTTGGVSSSGLEDGATTVALAAPRTSSLEPCGRAPSGGAHDFSNGRRSSVVTVAGGDRSDVTASVSDVPPVKTKQIQSSTDKRSDLKPSNAEGVKADTLSQAVHSKSTKGSLKAGTSRPSRPVAPPSATSANDHRHARPVRLVAVARTNGDRADRSQRQPEPRRERPHELRLRTDRPSVQRGTESDAASVAAPRRGLEESSNTNATTQPRVEPLKSPDRHSCRSPEKLGAYSPRVYVEEYELPPRKAPVFKQTPKKSSIAKERRRKLLPAKSPPNLRIDLPSMDRTKRNWLFLNMFRHGDDVSKYEPFIPKLLVGPSAPPHVSTGRPYSATQQSYASSQADAIAGSRGSRSLRNGRRLVTPQDAALRDRERQWAPVKPLESAIPMYDSILDKFCTTVTSPVIQRQIYQTRQHDLSPQLAYVLEKRVEKQWRESDGSGEAYTTSLISGLAPSGTPSPSGTTPPSLSTRSR